MLIKRDAVGIALCLAILFYPAVARAHSTPSSTSNAYETLREIGKIGILSLLVVSITSQIVRKSND